MVIYKVNEIVKQVIREMDYSDTKFLKIVKVRDTEENPITNKTYKYNNIQRSRYLLTCVDNLGQFRNIYDCNVKKLNFLDKLQNMFVKMISGRR
jgi:hypothetical protein